MNKAPNIPNKVLLRKVQSSEVAILRELAKRTFVEAFAHQNEASDMALYVQQAFDENQITKEYNHPESSFYFTLMDDQIVGYLKLNTGAAQSEYFGNAKMEIERIYVLHNFQGNGIGQFLINRTLEFAMAAQMEAIWLGVWEENHKALKFYEKNGFVPFDRHTFLLGNDLQTDILMIRQIHQ